jgi:uncharacterized protein (DUF2141 family)
MTTGLIALVAMTLLTGQHGSVQDKGSVSGTVVSLQPMSEPIARVTVVLVVHGDSMKRWTTVSDNHGRFEFAGIPAGSYDLIASKPNYLTTMFGATQFGIPVGSPVVLSVNERVDVEIRLAPGAVISGAVRDEGGQPVPSIQVRLKRIDPGLIEELAGGALSVGLVRVADDLGQFRFFQLPPGQYIVSAFRQGFGAAEVVRTTSDELRWAELVGHESVPMSNLGTKPRSGPRLVFPETFFGDATNSEQAQIVTVHVGEDIQGTDITFRPMPASTIAGAVVDPTGRPATGILMQLVPRSGREGDLGRQAALLGLGLASGPRLVRTDNVGRFSLSDVIPGSYKLLARTPYGVSRAMWAASDLTSSGEDLSGISMVLAPTLTVRGRIVTPPSLHTAGNGGLRPTIELRAIGGSATSVFGAANAIEGIWVVRVPNVIPGTYRLIASLDGLALSSVTYGGREVMDLPFALGDDVRNELVLTFASGAEVSGRLTNTDGQPSLGQVLVLFSVDRQLWFRGSRGIRDPVRPSTNGAFTFTGVPAGDYYLAAVGDTVPFSWVNPDFLSQMSQSAIRLSLTAGERKIQDVRLASQPVASGTR